MASPEDFRSFSLADVLRTKAELENAGMRRDYMQSQMQDAQQERQTKLHDVGIHIAKGLVMAAKDAGMDPSKPGFQDWLNQASAPGRQYLASLGHQDPGGDTQWPAIQQLAAMDTAGAKMHNLVPVMGKDGPVWAKGMSNGEIQPTEFRIPPTKLPEGSIPMLGDNGQTNVVTAPGAPESKGIMEGMTYKEVELSNGKKGYVLVKDASPGATFLPSATSPAPATKPQQSGPMPGTPKPGRGNFVGKAMNDMSQEDINAFDALKTNDERVRFINNWYAKNQPPTNAAPAQTIGQSTEDAETIKANVRSKNEIDLEGKKEALKLKQDEDERKAKATRMLKTLNTDFNGDSVEQLVKAATGSGAGAIADELAGFVGHANKGAIANTKLKELESALLSDVPRPPGAQSDAELANYKALVGNIADPKTPAPVKAAALAGIKALLKRWGAVEENTGTSPSNQGETKEQIRDRLRKELGM